MKFLTYQDKMALSRQLLKAMRLRLTGKPAEVLAPNGLTSDEDPAGISLIGGLAPKPDPNYHREQPPSAMGMVLMVQPDDQGRIEVSLQGRFDVTHRYIPAYQDMRKQVQVKADGMEKDKQKIPDCFKRFSVEFSGVSFSLNTSALNKWSSHKLEPLLKSLGEAWSVDPRIFRICQTNVDGYPTLTVPWGHEDCVSDSELADLVGRHLFIGSAILTHDVVLRVRLRAPPPNFSGQSGRYLLEIYLQNNTDSLVGRAYGLNRPALLDVMFKAHLQTGRQFDVPHRLQPEDYRYQPEDGVAGYGVSCAVTKEGAGWFATNSMPVFEQPRVDAPSPAEVGMPLEASFALLQQKPLEVLDGFVQALKNYKTTWDTVEAELSGPDKTAELKSVQQDLKDYQFEIERIEGGIELLRKHPDLLRCFVWMNEAMQKAVKLQGKSFEGWHLFQLGFILTQIRAIYERHALPHERQALLHDGQPASNFADVLWFSTGGGKTEAYLGIIAMAMIYGRLKGRLYGVTAWMRFPLRMLSAQQFQRLSYVVAQMEMIRCREKIPGHPFTVGYYTGQGTPNKISRPNASGGDIFLPEVDEGQLQRFRFVTDCPYCGTTGSVHMVADLERVRMLHCCANEACWSNTQTELGAYGEGIAGEIGIYASDEECYRYLPTVLVGTVDKLAVIAHNERFAGFLGAFRHFRWLSRKLSPKVK